jgi:DNA-binding CsgD family transcriptional regulator
MTLQASSGRMVGRETELGRLMTLLDDAEAGQAVVAVISGDAGIGKSRLVSEISARAAGRGFIVLSGQCAELGDSVPYLPLADALRGATQNPATGVKDALASRPALSRLLPDGGDRSAGGNRADDLARQQMFGGVLGLLAELAAARPVLLVLEDLHWADGSTRDLVTFLSRMLHRDRIALIVTYRSDDLHRRHPLRPVVAELQRLPNVFAVALGPLEPAAMAEHLTALAGAGAGTGAAGLNTTGLSATGLSATGLNVAELDAAELNDIVARAEGNAYYAEELLAAANRSLPAGLAALLLDRVEQLSDAAQRVLRTAAVAGRRAEDELVRVVSGLGADEYEDAVREAVAHQLLIADGTEGYAFRHALLREAVYADLLPGERTRLHAAMSTLLSDERRLAVPGTAAQLAQHCLASHDVQGAFTASIRAAKEADEVGAPAEAHRHYDQALALWDRVTDPEQLAGSSRGKLGLESANMAAASGDVMRAVHLLRRLRQPLTHADPPSADVKLLARVGERLAYYLLKIDDPKAEIEAIEVARATVAEIPAEPPSWYYARAVGTYAHVLLNESDAEAKEWGERTLTAARAAQAPWVEADALATLSFIADRDGRRDEAIELLTAAYKQAREAKVLGVELRAAYNLGRARLERGELATGASIAHQGGLRASQTGLNLAPYGLDLQHLHFQCHFGDGRWDHAQEIADGFPVRVTGVAEALLSAMALFIDVARGNHAVAERTAWLEPFWPAQGFDVYIARSLLAEHALWAGDTARAIEHAQAAIGVADAANGPQSIRPAAVAVSAWADRAVRARVGGDDPAEHLTGAAELLTVAREGAAFPRRPKFVLGPEGRGWLARAEAEYGRAAGQNDPKAWLKVMAEFGPAYVYEIARTRWRLAEALAEAGRRDEAADQWQLAARAADKLGARPLRRALDDLARRARIGTVHERSSMTAGLTSREREVLRLIAAGRSNREIAATLFITAKTASVHVSNILGKLGAASRTEAAAIAHREGLAG